MPRTIVAAQIGAGVFAVGDFVRAVVGAGEGVPFWAGVRGAVVQVGLALGIGLVVGLLARVIRGPGTGTGTGTENGVRGTGIRVGSVVGGVVGVVVAAGVAAWVALFADARFHDGFLIAVFCAIGGVLAVGVGVAVGLPIRRAMPWSAPWWAVVALVVVLAAAVGVVSFVVETPARMGLWAIALLIGAVIAGVVVFRSVTGRWVWAHVAATVVLLALAFGPPGDDETFRARAWGEAVLAPGVERALWGVLDRDGDGFSGVFGGGDCDEGNAARSPWGIEVAGNGQDEDCRFGDLVEVAPAAGTAPEASPAKTFVLLTVSGLDVNADGRLAPALPQVEARLDAGLRFTNPVGMAGPVLSIAGVMLRGRLPLGVDFDARGWPAGGLSAPFLVESAGGKAYFVTQRATKGKRSLEPFFVISRSFWQTDNLRGAVDRAVRYLAEVASTRFLWVHVVLPRKGELPDADAAIARLIDAVRRMPEHRLLVVGLSQDRGGSAPRSRKARKGAPGGPIALLGAAAGRVDAPVGLLDVYPTILRAMALDERAADWPEHEPVVGVPLDATPRHDAAITAWFTEEELTVGAVTAAGAVVLDEPAHALRLHPEKGASRTIGEGTRAPPEWARPAVELLRDRLMAPRLAHLNRLRAAARRDAAPDALEGMSATFGRSLQVLGCTVTPRAGNQVELVVYLRGGARFGASQRLHYKVSSVGRKMMQARLVPYFGLLPFGSFGDDEVIAMPLLFDTRPLNPGSSWLWLGVADAASAGDEDNVDVEGTGSTGGWARVCPFEVVR